MPTDDTTAARVAVVGSYAKAIVITADRIPTRGETLVGRDYRQTFGGKGSDMAVQAARLGAAVDFIGVVGDDPFGREFLDLLADEGVTTTHVRVTRDQPTGVGLIIKDEAGHNVIVVDPGANAVFSADDVAAASAPLGRARVALAQLEIPLDTALAGLAAAKRAGSLTVLNPAPALPLATVLPPDGLAGVDVITPNETEARVLLGLDPHSNEDNRLIADRLLAMGAGAVVITRGEHGVDLFTPEDHVHVAPHAVDVVDSNGAGDSFNAGLAVALAEGRALDESVRFANAVAALCCESWETVPSYRDRATVDAFLAESGVRR